jgi:hypothetical protein
MVMTDERWSQLEANFDERLTEDEILRGWHFCGEFDGLLLVVGDPGCDCEWVDYERY